MEKFIRPFTSGKAIFIAKFSVPNVGNIKHKQNQNIILIYLIVILFSIIHSIPSFSQNNLINFSTSSNPADGSISIYGQSIATGIYTLKIKYNIVGFGSSFNNPRFKTISQGTVLIDKFIPDRNAGIREFGYSFAFYPGIAFRKAPDNYMHYVLPICYGKSTEAIPIKDLNNILKQNTTIQNAGQGFTYEQGDTICAARAGLVFNVNDQVKVGEGNGISYSAQRNQIQIQHKDGTLAEYEALAPIKSLVENGDNVIPGQPIAVFNAPSSKYIVLFTVRYLDNIKLSNENPGNVYSNLPIYFFLNENNVSTSLIDGQQYEAIKSLAIITEELSKREKKKLGFID